MFRSKIDLVNASVLIKHNLTFFNSLHVRNEMYSTLLLTICLSNMSATKHAFSIDLEDWYHGMELPFDQWKGKEDRLRKGTDVVLELLEQTSSKATFFTLGWIAEKYPELMREIVNAGHEIASHGFNHEKVYDLSPEAFRDELKRTKGALEKASGKGVLGHRAPFFSVNAKSLWALDIIKECGFVYDCSISPVKTWRYGIAGCPDEVFTIKENGLVEFPVSTFKFLNKQLGIGGAYFRIFPYFMTNGGLKKKDKSGHPAMFYAHPWEYDPTHPKIDEMEFKAGLTHYFNLKGMASRTKKMLSNYDFTTVVEVVEDLEKKGRINELSISQLDDSKAS